MKATLLTLAALSLAITGCHTYAWQPVADDLKGTWTLQPVEPNYIEQWTFNNGQLTISINGTFLTFTDDNGATVGYMTYHVENLITNHYLIIDNLPTSAGPYRLHDSINRWLVIMSATNEFYISSESKEGLKGGWQYHFFKV